MIIITAWLSIINDGVSGTDDDHDQRAAQDHTPKPAERPCGDCRTRSRAPLRAALLRVRSSSHWVAGTLAYASVAAPRPCDAPGHGPTDCLRQGVRFWRVEVSRLLCTLLQFADVWR